MVTLVLLGNDNNNAEPQGQKHYSCITLACAGQAVEVPDAFLIAHSTGAEMLDAANRFLRTVVFAQAPALLRAGCTAFEIAVYDAEVHCWIILVAMGGKAGERERIRADEAEYTRLFAKKEREVSHVKIYIRSKGMLDWCIPGAWYLQSVRRWLQAAA